MQPLILSITLNHYLSHLLSIHLYQSVDSIISMFEANPIHQIPLTYFMLHYEHSEAFMLFLLL